MFEFDQGRVEKLDQLREEGIAPYPHGLKRQHSTADVLALIGEREQEVLAGDETEVVIAGRVLFKNEMGKAGFARLQDGTGRVQVYVKKNIIGEEAFPIWKRLDTGDHLWVRGRLMRTRTGEATVQALEIRLASKCISAMPDKHKGVQDREFRARNRYVDLFMNDQARATFQSRSRIISQIRRYFEDRGFLEVETPMMHVIPGGAAARPFVTHHNDLDLDLYLRIAPELFLKRLVVGGIERVYEINKSFRNEGTDTQHNPEFTMLEFYWAYATWQDLMALTEELVRELAESVTGGTTVKYGDLEIDFGSPWRRLRMSDGIAEYAGIDPADVHNPEALRAKWVADHPDAKPDDLPTTMGKWFELFFDTYVEKTLVQPTFVTHFPTEISPLSRRSADDPAITDRFELFIAGREIANGFNELNDPVDQAGRFEAQATARTAGDQEAMYFDGDYINALSYGMPPTAGEGIGIDRLVMLLTDSASIRDVILFPTLRPVG